MTIRDALLNGRRRPKRRGVGATPASRGDGYEFAELRAYGAGDDARRIDWAASARSGELQTRVLLEETALTIASIVDTSASMNVGRARALARAADEALRAWRASATADDRYIAIGAGRAEAFDLVTSLSRARRLLPRGAALLVISDWYDLASIDALEVVMLGTRLDCTALVARDPWHDDLPLAGFVRLRGAEGGCRRVFIGARERGNYREAVALRERAVRAQLGGAGWRTGILAEQDGAASLRAAFGVRA